jgi:thiol-disulfide isomerase/thioredoxin
MIWECLPTPSNEEGISLVRARESIRERDPSPIMPRPPILDPLDFRAIHASGLPWKAWLAIAESRENANRMETLRREQVLDGATLAVLGSLNRDVHVIAIAEDWCGDVHRHAPVIQRMAEASPRVHLRFVARADHPELFKRFLTNGGEAIPKFIFFNDLYVECGNWGPMPAECRRIIARGKGAGDIGAARKRVSGLYEADPNREIVVAELLDLITTATCTTP